MIFEPGQVISGFRIDEVREIPDIDSVAYIGRHEASGARLLYLANDDEDKSFAIGFKTPPADDTGVFHILEHSVLCGSEKFPVKEPFVNLLQGSMQTFLNAMTFSDKPLYPVASTNNKDLMNLADVYMDAVFNPAIYTDPHIFMQEGWHYEVAEGKPTLNGVVLNEMKGAFGDPEETLNTALRAALFPDTCYGFESGGLPDAIPDLTYGEFLNEHRRHYRPDNSYIILYGDLDARAMLAFLDEKYLSRWVAQHAGDEGTWQPRTIESQAPVAPEPREVSVVTTPDNEMAALGFVLPGKRDRLRVMATSVLLSALAGTNESPLRRALLDADLADAITFPLADDIMQPYVTLVARGLHPGARERLKPTFREILGGLIAEGFDREMLLASIVRSEFSLRERDFGISSGVVYAMNALSSWLYDDEAVIRELQFAEDFAEMRRLTETGYFEKLAAELFLDNPHTATVHLNPIPEDPNPAEARRLAAVADTWLPEDFARADEELAALRARQEREDNPEDLATLPRLALADLSGARERPGWHTEARSGDTLLIHEAPTAGIGYFSLVLPAAALDADDLVYLSIASKLLGRLNTSRHTALELDTLSLLHLGHFSFVVGAVDEDTDENAIHTALYCGASALVPESAFAASYLAELLCGTDFSDLERIRTLLTQGRIAMEDGFVNYGNTVARSHIDASFCPAAALSERINGIPFYRFIKDLLEHWDERAPELPECLAKVTLACARACGAIISVAGGEEALATFPEAWDKALADWGVERDAAPAQPQTTAETIPLAGAADAFTVPGNVCFNALGCDLRVAAKELGWPEGTATEMMRCGMWPVAQSLLSFDFLWNEVRVKGGAYGAGFTQRIFRSACYSSFRDPRIDETLERFAASASWLANLEIDEAGLNGYIISSVSTYDRPVKPRALVSSQVTEYLRGRQKDLRLVCRAEALTTTADDLRRMGGRLAEMIPLMHRCCIGAPAIIAGAKTPFDVQTLVETDAPAADSAE